MIKDIIYRVIELISVFWISMLVMLPSTTIVRFWGSQNIVEYTVVFACGLVTALVSVFFIAYREGYKQKEMGARTPVVLLTALIIQMIISIPFGFRLYIAGPTSSLSHIFAILIRLPVDVYDDIPLWMHFLSQLVCDACYAFCFFIAWHFGKRKRKKNAVLLFARANDKVSSE